MLRDLLHAAQAVPKAALSVAEAVSQQPLLQAAVVFVVGDRLARRGQLSSGDGSRGHDAVYAYSTATLVMGTFVKNAR